MAVKRFSDITVAPVPPQPTDYVVGVTTGAVDYRIPIDFISPAVPSGGNLDFYVATTGSDSNPGTITSPFATIQHGLFAASRFDYQALYAPTVHVADGTYTVTNVIGLPEVAGVGVNTVGATLVGNTATPANCVIHDTGSNGIFQGAGANSQWNVGGFQVDTPVVVFQMANFSGAGIGSMNFNDSSGGLSLFLINMQLSDVVFAPYFHGGTTWNILTATPGFFAQAKNDSNFSFGGMHINFQPATNFTFATLQVQKYSSIGWGNNVYTNFAGVTANPLAALLQFSNVNSLPTGTEADVPGTPGTVQPNSDGSSGWFNPNTAFGGLYGQTETGLPAAANLSIGTWGVFKDTSGGGVYIAYNDAGTIKKLQLV